MLITPADLLNNRGPVKILEDVVGTVQMLGAVEQSTEFVDEMLCQIETARRLRMTSSTAKNDQSTRSHAVCQFLVTNKSLNRVGSFLLVDLAGSEANADILQHSKERMAETREINKSLAVLKDCIRARAQWSIARGNVSQKHIHIPFRNSSLTKLLKNAFDVNCSETGKTLFIACISPSIIDIPQSKNTLRYGELLRIPVPKAKSRAYDPKVPTTWNNVNVREWIRKNVGNFLDRIVNG
jgi:kinesin family protein 2/24